MSKQIITCYNCEGEGWVVVHYSELAERWTCPVCLGKKFVEVSDEFAKIIKGRYRG